MKRNIGIRNNDCDAQQSCHKQKHQKVDLISFRISVPKENTYFSFVLLWRISILNYITPEIIHKSIQIQNIFFCLLQIKFALKKPKKAFWKSHEN